MRLAGAFFSMPKFHGTLYEAASGASAERNRLGIKQPAAH
jgi:hypothetical protein